MDVERVIAQVKKALPDLIALYRFGSHAKGDARPESDVDFAILVPAALPAGQLLNLQQELAALLHKDVDLVDLRAASTVLRMQVLSTGEGLFSGNDGAREEFETMVYSSYARLNEERRGILEDVRARGSVYAG